MRKARGIAVLVLHAFAVGASASTYVNLESSHVHPIALTPSGGRLLVVNTPDALLEVFVVRPDGSLEPSTAIPVGLEPVTVVARTNSQAWVVNNLSDTVSIVDLDLGLVTKTLNVGDEPTDVAFAAGRAFVAVSSEDSVRVYNLFNLDAAPTIVPLLGRDVRALAVSNNGQKVYAVVLKSGNETTVVGMHHTFPSTPHALDLDLERLGALGLRDVDCVGPPPPYPGLPAGIARNPALLDPPDGIPKVGLIVHWNATAGQWQDEAGQDWTHCLPFRLADNDLFVIDATSLAVNPVKHLGTTLFDVSVHPTTGKIYVPHTEARNRVRFEHPQGLQGHLVDNRLSVVNPLGGTFTVIDLNSHIDRESDPGTNLAERVASISQPGMMVWQSDGSAGYLTAIGSRKLFRVNGSCLAGGCIFGPDRAKPQAVDVGEGPTGVALREAVDPADERLYVLNRISHSVAIVDASSLVLLDEQPLHDPSSSHTRVGRRFLYDGIDGSRHGDASCASCHVSGDLDGLAWDLGDPTGSFAPYDTPLDNVRFVQPLGGDPMPCDPSTCADHDGFDPQKGPMTTQTLHGLLEPLHWRGDRATLNDFNAAFVSLMGTENVAAPHSKPGGLPAADMDLFRQFLLELRSGPNPFRGITDETPCGLRAVDPLCEVFVRGNPFPGNPTEGYLLFAAGQMVGGQPCIACHGNPFGTGGGQLGGLTPTEPTSSAAAALVQGDPQGSAHSDMKIPHLRNMYEKLGPVLAAPGDPSLPETTSGFGYAHDGAVPDLLRFLSSRVFNLSADLQAQEVRDLASFLFHFPTEMRSAVGRQVTLAPGAPPTGSPAQEALLAKLVSIGDLLFERDCDLVASTISAGSLHHWRLQDGLWLPDTVAAPSLSTSALRQNAAAPITFTCVTVGSGLRLGGDRDEDAVLNGDDCAAGDPQTLQPPSTVMTLVLTEQGGTTLLAWEDQAKETGLSVRYDVLFGGLSALAKPGVKSAECSASGLTLATYEDAQADPVVGDGYWYLIRATNPCGVGDLGPGLDTLETLACQ